MKASPARETPSRVVYIVVLSTQTLTCGWATELGFDLSWHVYGHDCTISKVFHNSKLYIFHLNLNQYQNYLKCILKKNNTNKSDWHRPINSSQLTHHAMGRFITLHYSHDNINQFIPLQYFEKCSHRFVCPVNCQTAPRTISCLQSPCALPLFI